MLINVREIVERKKIELKGRVEELKKRKITPKIAFICASNDAASKIYMTKKKQMCEELGIDQVEYVFDNEQKVTTEKIVELIKKLNEDSKVHGILVQLPLFQSLDAGKILSSISPFNDVDSLTPFNLGKVMCDTSTIYPCTPKGIMMILDDIGTVYEGKNAVVVGRSNMVGKPIASMLLRRNASVRVCHSKVSKEDLKIYTSHADILVVAVGNKHLIKEDMVKDGAIVIDVGITRDEKTNKIYGDCDTDKIAKKANITPVPGGVGLTTVISLMDNVINIAESIG